ncbi:hypothetical protein B9479_007055 [Cryptococcus floricola]|uniref:Ubiquitin-like protease family profile domain-containing protein n=1 Tax=Cryptococcus floricola TaxID=2591691 RepID=A0A5D3AQB0_9TREE|nr:hypothetical protein B9479_007055 [Cryptococcus floricola]
MPPPTHDAQGRRIVGTDYIGRALIRIEPPKFADLTDVPDSVPSSPVPDETGKPVKGDPTDKNSATPKRDGIPAYDDIDLIRSLAVLVVGYGLQPVDITNEQLELVNNGSDGVPLANLSAGVNSSSGLSLASHSTHPRRPTGLPQPQGMDIEPGELVFNTLIDDFMDLLNHKLTEKDPEGSIIAVNTQFMQFIMGSNGRVKEGYLEWVEFAPNITNNDAEFLGKHSKILIPIHLPNQLHFVAAVMDFEKFKITFYDSALSEDLTGEVVEEMERMLAHLVKLSKVVCPDKANTWSINIPRHLERQGNGCDCGVWTMWHLLTVACGHDPGRRKWMLRKVDIPFIRQMIVIIFGADNMWWMGY